MSISLNCAGTRAYLINTCTIYMIKLSSLPLPTCTELFPELYTKYFTQRKINIIFKTCGKSTNSRNPP